MPPVSQRQARLFRAAASGRVKLKGMSREKAKEMVSGYPTRDLPETTQGDTFKKAVAKRRRKGG